MKKTKLASQDKSKHCSHSKCPNRSVITVTFGNEKRKLCQIHYDALMRKDSYFEVVLKKASLL